jgi:hypothetical protein
MDEYQRELVNEILGEVDRMRVDYKELSRTERLSTAPTSGFRC